MSASRLEESNLEPLYMSLREMKMPITIMFFNGELGVTLKTIGVKLGAIVKHIDAASKNTKTT